MKFAEFVLGGDGEKGTIWVNPTDIKLIDPRQIRPHPNIDIANSTIGKTKMVLGDGSFLVVCGSPEEIRKIIEDALNDKE